MTEQSVNGGGGLHLELDISKKASPFEVICSQPNNWVMGTQGGETMLKYSIDQSSPNTIKVLFNSPTINEYGDEKVTYQRLEWVEEISGNPGFWREAEDAIELTMNGYTFDQEGTTPKQLYHPIISYSDPVKNEFYPFHSARITVPEVEQFKNKYYRNLYLPGWTPDPNSVRTRYCGEFDPTEYLTLRTDNDTNVSLTKIVRYKRDMSGNLVDYWESDEYPTSALYYFYFDGNVADISGNADGLFNNLLSSDLKTVMKLVANSGGWDGDGNVEKILSRLKSRSGDDIAGLPTSLAEVNDICEKSVRRLPPIVTNFVAPVGGNYTYTISSAGLAPGSLFDSAMPLYTPTQTNKGGDIFLDPYPSENNIIPKNFYAYGEATDFNRNFYSSTSISDIVSQTNMRVEEKIVDGEIVETLRPMEDVGTVTRYTSDDNQGVPVKIPNFYYIDENGVEGVDLLDEYEYSPLVEAPHHKLSPPSEIDTTYTVESSGSCFIDEFTNKHIIKDTFFLECTVEQQFSLDESYDGNPYRAFSLVPCNVGSLEDLPVGRQETFRYKNMRTGIMGYIDTIWSKNELFCYSGDNSCELNWANDSPAPRYFRKNYVKYSAPVIRQNEYPIPGCGWRQDWLRVFGGTLSHTEIYFHTALEFKYQATQNNLRKLGWRIGDKIIIEINTATTYRDENRVLPQLYHAGITRTFTKNALFTNHASFSGYYSNILINTCCNVAFDQVWYKWNKTPANTPGGTLKLIRQHGGKNQEVGWGDVAKEEHTCSQSINIGTYNLSSSETLHDSFDFIFSGRDVWTKKDITPVTGNMIISPVVTRETNEFKYPPDTIMFVNTKTGYSRFLRGNKVCFPPRISKDETHILS